jgi:hypothetical protein
MHEKGQRGTWGCQGGPTGQPHHVVARPPPRTHQGLVWGSLALHLLSPLPFHSLTRKNTSPLLKPVFLLFLLANFRSPRSAYLLCWDLEYLFSAWFVLCLQEAMVALQGGAGRIAGFAWIIWAAPGGGAHQWLRRALRWGVLEFILGRRCLFVILWRCHFLGSLGLIST